MGIELAIAAAGLAVSAAGVGVSVYGGIKTAAAQKEGMALQMQAEAERKKQMDLDATRRKREIVRQSVMARSQALNTTTSQGASAGSGLPGAYGSVSGRTNVNELGVNQNQEIGTAMFGINQGISAASMEEASAKSFSAMGAGMTSLGNMALTNAGQIYKIGSAAYNFAFPGPTTTPLPPPPPSPWNSGSSYAY